jgi:proline dehydrogenase
MSILRRFLLFLSRNGKIRRFVEKRKKLFGVERFIAGETITEALDTVEMLNQQGFACTLDFLGEYTITPEDARHATKAYLELLQGIGERKLNCNVSVKLSQLGLDIDQDFCEKNLQEILTKALTLNNFVRIDMEDYLNTGIVIQAYLYRSYSDVYYLRNYSLRLVKGAYLESETVAFRSKKDTDEQFKQMIALHLKQGAYTAIATHDPKIIDFTLHYVRKHGIPRNKYEFQMLYGIRTDLQRKILAEGEKVRLYIPFGKDWYGYFLRRLAERPANLWFVVKGVLKK